MTAPLDLSQMRRALSYLASFASLLTVLFLPQLAKAATLSPATLPVTIVNTYYEQRVTASSTLVTPVTWSVPSGVLPAGLMLSSAGDYSVFLKGTSTVVGTTSFRLTATGANGNTDSLPYTFIVENPVNIIATTLPTANTGVSYNYTFAAGGGTTPYSWNMIQGTLPIGLQFDSALGRITGTTFLGGVFSITVRVTDAYGYAARRDFILNVATTPTTDGDLAARLANFTRIGMNIHELVKLPNDGDNTTQHDSAVYYLSQDGRRHAFPNSNIYFSWYDGFSNIRILSNTDLASIPLGNNATYHPGVKLVKFLTDNNVYAVAGNRNLRWVKTEAVAQGLYGNNWRTTVDDIQDTFYGDYTIDLGDVIMNMSDYSPSVMRASFIYPSQVLLQ